MRSVIQTPCQLPDLIRTAFDAYFAERALRKGRKQLGPGFASPFVKERVAECETADEPSTGAKRTPFRQRQANPFQPTPTPMMIQ